METKCPSNGGAGNVVCAPMAVVTGQVRGTVTARRTTAAHRCAQVDIGEDLPGMDDEEPERLYSAWLAGYPPPLGEVMMAIGRFLELT